MAAPPCLCCILKGLSGKEKRCQKAHEPEHTTYVNESDPAYMGNLPLDELVSHIESTTKGKSKRRKFWKKKGKAEVSGNQEIPTEENEPEADEEPTVVETTKMENTAISHNCDNTDEVHSTVDHQMTKQPTTTTTGNAKKNRRKKKNKKTADPSGNSPTETSVPGSDDVVQSGDKGLVSDEAYLKSFMTDEECEAVMKMIKDPGSGITPSEVQDVKRSYPLEKIHKIKEYFTLWKKSIKENSDKGIGEVIKGLLNVQTKENVPETDVDAVKMENIGEVQSNFEEMNTTKTKKNKRKKRKTTGSGDTNTTEQSIPPLIHKRGGTVVSDKEFIAALKGDPDLLELAKLLKYSKTASYDEDQLQMIQSDYSLDYLQSLRTAFVNFKTGVDSSAFLKEMNAIGLKAVPVAVKVSSDVVESAEASINGYSEKLKPGINLVIPMKSGKILSNEEYLKALLNDDELYNYAKMLKSVNYKYDGKELYEIQREYPLEYLKSLRAAARSYCGVSSVDDVKKTEESAKKLKEDEEFKSAIEAAFVKLKAENEHKMDDYLKNAEFWTLDPLIKLARFSRAVQMDCGDSFEKKLVMTVSTEAIHKALLEIAETINKDKMKGEVPISCICCTNKSEQVAKAGNPNYSGEILSNEDFMKALHADKELYSFAKDLKKAYPKYDGMPLYAIQSDYSIGHIKHLINAVRNYNAGLPTNTALDEIDHNDMRELAMAIMKPDADKDKNNAIAAAYCKLGTDHEKIMEERQKDPEFLKNVELFKLYSERMASKDDSDEEEVVKKNEERNPEDYTDEESVDSRQEAMERSEMSRKKRFEAMKNRRDKKVKETNTFVVDEATPGYVGNRSLDDILKHIESKPVNNSGKSNVVTAQKKNLVESVVESHQMMEKKEIVPIKENKKKLKKSPVELLCNKPTKKKELVSDDLIQKTLLQADDLTVKQHLEESAAVSTELDLDDASPKARWSWRRIEDKLKNLPHDPIVKKYLLESPAQNAPTKSHSLPKTSIDPAENAIYGQVLKHYNMDKEKETGVTSSPTVDTPPLVDLQKSEAPLRDPAEEKAWLEYSKRMYCRKNCKEKNRSMENPHNGVFGRATQFDHTLFDLD